MSTTSPVEYDVIVIGSGGGSKITRPVANMGKKVAIVEKGYLGGTCLNHGCIPSKMLIHPAEVADIVRAASKYELSVDQNIRVDFSKLVSRVTDTIMADSSSIAPSYDQHPNITLYQQHAHFISNYVVQVGDETITAPKIVIAVGAKARIPDIPGLVDTPYFTYKEALRNTIQPKSMAVIGGGYIAVELGYFFGALGTDTTFFVRSKMAAAEDVDVQEAFQAAFANRFDVKLGILPSKISHDGSQFHLFYVDGGVQKELIVDSLLVAAGVVPCTDDLGLENTDIELSDSGNILVDAFLETEVRDIYAFGDVIGRYLFRHSANFEGDYVLENHFINPHKKAIKYPPMPHAIFTNPQVAGLGKTEQELQSSGKDYLVGLNHYKNSAMGMALLPEVGFVKLLFDKQTLALVGAHIIGDDAATMCHMLIAYMNMKATLNDILSTIYIHPALPEIVRNAARKAAVQL